MKTIITSTLAIAFVLTAGLSPAWACGPGKGKEGCGCSQATETPSCGCDAGAPAAAAPAIPAEYLGKKVTCPVSGEELTVAEGTLYSVYQDTYYFFCCGGCKPRFDANPGTFFK